MRVCVADLEANGLLHEATRVWCGVFKDINTSEVFEFNPKQIPEMLGFMDTCDVLIMHNGLDYDWPLLEKLYGYQYQGQKVDTLVMSRLQKPSRLRPFNMPRGVRGGPHSIAAWGYRVGRGKPDHDDWQEYSPAMLHRCTEDVEIGHLVYNELLKEAKGMGWKSAWKLSFKLFDILHKQKEYGWLADREYMERCIGLLTHWIDRIDATITPRLPMIYEVKEQKVKGEYKHLKSIFLKSGKYSKFTKDWYDKNNIDEQEVRVAGPFSRILYRPVDLNSNKETKDFLLNIGWKPEEWNYKKGENGKPLKGEDGNLIKSSPKLSHDDSFNGVQGGLGRLVARRVQCRHRRSNIEGWIKLIREDGRISTPVSGLAETGRAKHKGVVNVPGTEAFFGKQMRKCFTCKKGYKIVGTDSAGCQNRMLAARVGDEFFTRTLLEGKKEDKSSIHFVNKRAIEEEIGESITYGNSKNLNYAFMFGASDKKLGSILNRGKEVGAKVRKALLGVAPGFENLVKKLTDEWKSNAKTRMVKTKWGYRKEYYDGWVKGLDGRPIFISSEHQILVYVLQSDEAIMMAAAYCMLYKRAEARGWKHGRDWGFLIWYHDEFQCEVREDLAEEFAALAEKCIEDAGKFYNINCPHKGESDIGNNWYETH